MPHPTTGRAHTAPHNIPFSKCVVIPPNHSKTIGLGTYTTKEPVPSFTLTCAPDQQETLGVSLDRLDLPGDTKYMLFYQFNNFGDRACEVKVVRDADT